MAKLATNQVASSVEREQRFMKMPKKCIFRYRKLL